MFELIIIPISAGLIAQAVKLITDGIPNNFDWQHLLSDYGGMPSSHSAFVSALATIIGLTQGFNSPTFAISFVLMIIVMRDAVGFRREIGKNAAFTNLVAKKIINKKEKINYLNEKMGHNAAEIIAGFAFGVSVSILMYLIFVII